jgi:hypothetical protein
VLFKVVYFSLEKYNQSYHFTLFFFSSVSVLMKFLPSISLNSFSELYLFGFIGKISLLLAICHPLVTAAELQ